MEGTPLGYVGYVGWDGGVANDGRQHGPRRHRERILARNPPARRHWSPGLRAARHNSRAAILCTMIRCSWQEMTRRLRQRKSMLFRSVPGEPRGDRPEKESPHPNGTKTAQTLLSKSLGPWGLRPLIDDSPADLKKSSPRICSDVLRPLAITPPFADQARSGQAVRQARARGTDIGSEEFEMAQLREEADVCSTSPRSTASCPRNELFVKI
jgi:hypothetical protein